MIGPLYAVVMGGLVRHQNVKSPSISDNEPRIIIAMVPCLNEGTVVVETIRKLQILDESLVVMVVDDGSDDDTSEVLSQLTMDQVYVVRREPPNCRQGKGAALNFGFEAITKVVADLGINPDNVIVGVFDADGEADPGITERVRPWFADPKIGAVQIAVRINNRKDSLLARMQDVEFAAYTEIFQYARNVLTSTGLGGNGQFARLSALQSLGREPWSDCLTEDLDLGIRLRLNGWITQFDGSVAVHQQGIHKPGRLIRQRTRWFQGHLQLWHLLPQIWRSKMPVFAKLDISGHLVMPVVTLIVSTAMLTGLVRLAKFAIYAPEALIPMFVNGPLVPWWYLIGFFATPLVAAAYWRTEPQIGLVRGLVLAHLYTFYTWVWFIAGVKAVARQVSGAGGWTKTARVGNEDEVIETGLELAPVLAGTLPTGVARDSDSIVSVGASRVYTADNDVVVEAKTGSGTRQLVRA